VHWNNAPFRVTKALMSNHISQNGNLTYLLGSLLRATAAAVMLVCSLAIAAQEQETRPKPGRRPAVTRTSVRETIVTDSILATTPDSLMLAVPDSVTVAVPDSLSKKIDPWDIEEREFTFNPDPTRAVWLAALFPGLGQLYNRRYWKLPIIVGGFMGLAYGTSWNNSMLRDYTRAYADLLDNDPSTKSYMNLFPPTTSESDLDKTWLSNMLRNRKDFYRRNRDLCIIAMVGVYILAIVDAYVDASLAHFDISPQLSMDVAPALIPDTRSKVPGVGLQWAFNF